VARVANSVEIRAGRTDDIEGTWSCIGVVARERAYIGFLDAPPLEASREFWSNLLDKGFPFEVAVDSGKVVGWCDIGPVPRPIFAHVGVLGMGLLPDFRGRGIGHRLITAALQHARKRCLERVELGVFAHNERARRLYESVGFVVEGKRCKRAKIDGQYWDEFMMALVF
jgi:RimJ/RimL family protein N-acetyltransferase